MVSSEVTAAAEGSVGELRRDPFAMLPFCGYNMADYFNHWLSIGTKTDAKKLPQIFFVNWFRRDDNGRFLWPGYGENSRVLKWVFERLDGTAKAEKTAIGYLPADGALDTNGVDVTKDDLKELLSVDAKGWKEAVPQIREHYAAFGERLPKKLASSLDELESALE